MQCNLFNIIINMRKQDLSFVRRLSAAYQILKTPLQWSTINRITRTQQLQNLSTFPLYKFNGPRCLMEWVENNDTHIGGTSSSQMIWRDNTLTLKGNIITEQKQKLISLPYVGMQMIMPPFKPRVNCRKFNILQVRVRTDGRPYRITLNFTDFILGTLQCFGMIVDSSRQWQTLELPFGLFKSDTELVEVEMRRQLYSETILSHLGISTTSEVETQTEFEISDINLVYHSDVVKFATAYKRPIFLRSGFDYSKVREVDNGRETLTLKKNY